MLGFCTTQLKGESLYIGSALKTHSEFCSCLEGQISLLIMYYKEYQPRQDLRSIIACFWIIGLKHTTTPVCDDVVLPDGCAELIINTGAPFQRTDLLENKISTICEYAIVGQRRHTIEIHRESDISFFAIRFKPYGMSALLKVAGAEMTDQIMEHHKTRERIVNPIRKILESQLDILEKIHSIENLLIYKLNNMVEIKPYLKKAVEEIIIRKGQFSVNTFCKEHGIHKSTLQKSFLSLVGLTPKEYAGVVRFNNVHKLLKESSSESHTQVALESGYYDQSHMIKDFKKLSGLSPTAFLKANYTLPQIALEFSKSWDKYF